MPDDWNILEYEDVIYLFSEIRGDEFKCFLQGIITEKWTNSKGTFLRRLFNR
jgi:hypothetical protein